MSPLQKTGVFQSYSHRGSPNKVGFIVKLLHVPVAALGLWEAGADVQLCSELTSESLLSRGKVWVGGPRESLLLGACTDVSILVQCKGLALERSALPWQLVLTAQWPSCREQGANSGWGGGGVLHLQLVVGAAVLQGVELGDA